MIGVVLTHVLSFNFGTPLVNAAWNYLHFVVPVFVFCSGYILYAKHAQTTWSLSSVLRWTGTRTIRLLAPYYIVTAIHYLFLYGAPAVFSGLGLSWEKSFMVRTILLVGIDYGWLPLLFIELMIITPILLMGYKNVRIRFGIVIIGITSSVLFLFTHISLPFYATMWIPWSLVMMFAFRQRQQDMQRADKNHIHEIIRIALAFGVYLTLSTWISMRNGSHTLTAHKYPPDIYYLSYAYGMGMILVLLAKSIERSGRFQSLFRWISCHSYELYFIHYIASDFVQTIRHQSAFISNIWIQILMTFLLSGAGTYLYVRGKDMISLLLRKR